MSKQITLTVVTPERKVLEESVESAVIPAHDGELGVLNLRSPLMCELGTGALRYRSGGRDRTLVVDGGFAQIASNAVTVLTSDVALPESVTDAMIAAVEKAESAVSGSDDESVNRRMRLRRKAAVLRAVKG